MSTTVTGLSADRLFHTRSTHVPHQRPPPLTRSTPRSSSTSARTTNRSPATSAGPPGSTSSRSAVARSHDRDWVVTDQAAVDTELGILKTGKEADVFLLERAVDGGPGVVMAAKRYRSTEHRTFHRTSAYTEGRRGKDSREARAAAKGSTFGRVVAAGQWANAEWESLKRCWSLGLPVPYPVQIDGTELLMEWVSVDGETAPRLAQSRPDPGPARVVLRPAPRGDGHDGAARDRARRPVGVQPPRGG